MYGRANEDQDLADVGEEPEEDIIDTPDDDFLGTDIDGLDDLDAIMGDTFAADSDTLPPEGSPEMPSRAEQSRPEDSTMDVEDGALLFLKQCPYIFALLFQKQRPCIFARCLFCQRGKSAHTASGLQ